MNYCNLIWLLLVANLVYGRRVEESLLNYIGPQKPPAGQVDTMQLLVNRDLPQYSNSKGFILYEISSRAWLYELKEKYGTRINSLADVPLSEFYELKAGGVDMVWMQGIWKIGNYGVQLDRKDPKSRENFLEKLPDCTDADIIGSPYAVVEYSVNDELGGDRGLKALREKLKAADLKLMLDFVPNHMAVDCVWSNDLSKREFFILAPLEERANPSPDLYLPDGRAYGRDPYSGAWKDSAQLNYWNQSLRQAMMDNLMKVASMCDGIRVDMAMLILNDVIEKTWGDILRRNHYSRPEKEFWQEAIQKLRSTYPNTILMAEVYWNLDQQLQDLGFDATYDKTLYDIIYSNNLDSIRSYLSSKSEQFLAHSAHFVENHDEPRAAKYFGSRAIANSAASISFTLPGIRFQFHGEWQGKKNQLDIHLRRAAWEPEDPETLAFYYKLNQILSHDIFHQGNWSFINIEKEQQPEAWRLMAWKWRWIDTSDNNKVVYRLVVINHSDGNGVGCIPFDEAVSEMDSIELVELFTGSSYPKSRQSDNKICFVVEPWSLQIFAY
ncbi:hypothetical protein Gasu2_39900 [Galdieria sulphuraria]|uniref:Periplasmic alpha-amylase-like protein n=1 Tax=Galdieria sulphuraria TaxID=130081 RepID=M2XVV7_GALSU|nr:periplasmic alpha-amylase precursor-like protein [Galdieria sulphuraria]EME27564.1 periplasmic alpha-amylase precursor-like protein [Galdieria sulphuraria]GJD09759.1 hypothetical protein Gasu2_39900 [Galdieria sulphuraria]|eukprot:XP_005704084.1 periplasmic alpha-amylase precursor-like protein [Galdieria sulphuraria]